jgi:hypothetical protein
MKVPNEVIGHILKSEQKAAAKVASWYALIVNKGMTAFKGMDRLYKSAKQW